MILQHKRHNEARKLTGPVRDYMHQKFMLTREYIDELRCFEYEEDASEKQVLRILIYHPNLARSQHIALCTFKDLDQHREVLLYEGYVDTRGNLHIEDRQITAHMKRMSSQQH